MMRIQEWADGELVSEEVVDDEPPSIDTLLQGVPVEQVAWAITVGATLASRAGDLYAALEDIALSNTARPAIEIVTEVALSAVE